MRYRAGQRVRVDSRSHEGHHRTPGYLKGKTGSIEHVHASFRTRRRALTAGRAPEAAALSGRLRSARRLAGLSRPPFRPAVRRRLRALAGGSGVTERTMTTTTITRTRRSGAATSPQRQRGRERSRSCWSRRARSASRTCVNGSTGWSHVRPPTAHGSSHAPGSIRSSRSACSQTRAPPRSSSALDPGPSPVVVALENTATVHHLVVCTLCSCYPKALLGPPPDWYKSLPYRSRAVSDPRGVLAEFGRRARRRGRAPSGRLDRRHPLSRDPATSRGHRGDERGGAGSPRDARLDDRRRPADSTRTGLLSSRHKPCRPLEGRRAIHSPGRPRHGRSRAAALKKGAGGGNMVSPAIKRAAAGTAAP